MASPNTVDATSTETTAFPSPNSKTCTSQSRVKKRAASPVVNSCQTLISNSSSKKKKMHFTTSLCQVSAIEPAPESKLSGSSDPPCTTESGVAAKPQPFKDPGFVHSGIGGAAAGKKNRTWKNLKQILAAERALPWQLNDPNYYNIDAPPSLKPAKKYSDISGLPASYTDPQTKLRFTSSEEFAYIRLLPTDVVTGYLALRKASCVVP